MIGLDTSAIIDIFKGEQEIKDFLESNDEPFASNIMNYTEIFFGIDSGDDSYGKESEYYEEFFNNTYFIEMSRDASRKASKIYYDLKNRGEPISKFDCLIAACFLQRGVKKILTRNVKHFDRIEGLEVVSY